MYLGKEETTCCVCGQLAVLVETLVLMQGDAESSDLRMVQVIACPICGRREQPEPCVPVHAAH